MSPRSWRFGLTLAALCATPLGAGAARRDWIGSERCGSCHPAQLAAWRATAHARVRFPAGSSAGSSAGAAGAAGSSTAGPAGAGRAAACLGCHTTGEAPAGPVIELAVGCEACHGAGADYAAEDVMRNRRLAFDLGLVDLPAGSPVRAAVCAGCHRPAAMRPGIDLARPVHPPLRAAEAAP